MEQQYHLPLYGLIRGTKQIVFPNISHYEKITYIKKNAFITAAIINLENVHFCGLPVCDLAECYKG